MSLNPGNQLNLYGLKIQLNELINLYKNKKLPNKILLSGSKGTGKCTLAYHLVNFILSENEDFNYNVKDNTINAENKSFKLVQNKSNPNFYIIDSAIDKKNIEISQIRKLISNLSMSALNDKPRIVLIDNIELLNDNSVNGLLKVVEEPNNNVHFILINNNIKKFLTLKSRCLNFKINLSSKDAIEVASILLGKDIFSLVNKELIHYYLTPGKIFDLVSFSSENSIDLRNITLKEFLLQIINRGFYKKMNLISPIMYDFFELFLLKSFSLKSPDFYSYFTKKIYDLKKYNLDEEALLLEYKQKLLNE